MQSLTQEKLTCTILFLRACVSLCLESLLTPNIIPPRKLTVSPLVNPVLEFPPPSNTRGTGPVVIISKQARLLEHAVEQNEGA
jgi:hypothetical protein